ncbi:MAG: hypothetical protein WDN69_04085 [Aliidongia sp.]
MDQDGLAVDRAQQMHRLIRRQSRNAEAGAGVEIGIRRQRDSLGGRQHDIFGGGAEGTLPLSVPDPDALADPIGGNAVADLVDHTGAVAMGDDFRIVDRARPARLHI